MTFVQNFQKKNLYYPNHRHRTTQFIIKLHQDVHLVKFEMKFQTDVRICLKFSLKFCNINDY